MSGAPLAAAGNHTADDEARTLRGIARRLTTGVAVLTVLHDGVAHGATVSATSVVSQRPLTLCASLRRGSLLATLARDGGQFTVNVLSSRQALVADWFANPHRPSGLRQFDLVEWECDTETGALMLRHALAHLSCRLTDHLTIGDDDELLVAEVVTGRVGVGGPLVNFNGQLHGADFHDVARRRSWQTAGAVAASLD